LRATLPDDLSLRTSRLLGIKATSDKTSGRIPDIINRMIGENKLQKQPNGMINFPET